jgi:hydroxylaminobenzene mutase
VSAVTPVYDPLALFLVRLAAVHGLLTFVTGGYIAAAAGHAVPADVAMAVGTHLNAWFGLFLLLGIAWSLPMVALGDGAKRVIAYLLAFGTLSNVLFGMVKAWWGVHGLVVDDNPYNLAAGIGSNVLVVIPTTIALAVWAWGVWKPR